MMDQRDSCSLPIYLVAREVVKEGAPHHAEMAQFYESPGLDAT
jgi:hypothetical protein